MQAVGLKRPGLAPRRFVKNGITEIAPSLRRMELALSDGLEAWVRSGRQLTVLVGVTQPSPSFAFDLPLLRADAPAVPSPYGLMAQLLSVAARWPNARAAWRASAHSLSFILPQSLAADYQHTSSDSAQPVAALADLLQQLAGESPLVIQLDNLQRADEPSLKLLREVASAIEHGPILILGTYRADLPQPASLSEWLTDRLFPQLAFGPLWLNDLAILLDSLFGRKATLGTMIDAIKHDDRLMLLGGMAVIDACRWQGRWTDGLMLSERAIELAIKTEAHYLQAVVRLLRGEILIGLGQAAEAEAEFELVAKSPALKRDHDLAAAAAWGAYHARSMISAKRLPLPEVLKHWHTKARSSTDPLSAAALLNSVIAHLIESGQMNEAQVWQHDLEMLVDSSGHPMARYGAAYGLGEFLTRAQDWRSAVGAYRAALQHAAVTRDILGEARANSQLALALLELGDLESKNEGRERLSIAHSVLSRLNARPDMEKCEAGAKHFGLRPRQRRPSMSNRTPGSLTRREREVLALVVNGMTNRQIAQRLTISEKTAEGHVGNILAKLSCSSRIKAAELARATGLLEGVPA
jgi:DNA-binding CsgD family transcriptional regulator/tetratricopeptide (TPR) repeat protein